MSALPVQSVSVLASGTHTDYTGLFGSLLVFKWVSVACALRGEEP